MYFIHNRSICIQKGWSIFQAFAVEKSINTTLLFDIFKGRFKIKVSFKNLLPKIHIMSKQKNIYKQTSGLAGSIWNLSHTMLNLDPRIMLLGYVKHIGHYFKVNLNKKKVRSEVHEYLWL